MLFSGDAAPAMATMGQVRGGLAGVGETARVTNGGFLGFLGNVAKVGLAVVAGLAIASAAVVAFGLSSAKHLEDTGHAAYDMARAFGMQPTQASAWVAAGAAVGVEASSMSTGFKFLSKNIEGLDLLNNAAKMKEYSKELHAGTEKQKETARTALALAEASRPLQLEFQRLGVRTHDAHGHLRPINDVMFDLSNAFKKLPPDFDKAGLAMKLFGRGGLDMLPILLEGSAAIKTYMADAKAMGVVLTNDQVNAAEKAYKAQKQLDLAWAGATNQLGSFFLPMLTTVVTWMTSTGIPNIERFARWVGKELAPAVAWAKDEFTKAWPFIKKFGDQIVDAWPSVQKIAGIVRDDLKPALEKVIPLVVTAGTLFGDTIGPVLSTVADNMDRLNPLLLTMAGIWATMQVGAVVGDVLLVAGAFQVTADKEGLAIALQRTLGIEAVVNGLKASAAWVASAATSLAAWVADKATTVAIYALYAAESITNAAKASAAWVIAASKSSAGWVATRAVAVGSFVATSLSAGVEAVKSSAVWLAAQARILAGWVALQVRAIGTYVATVAAANPSSNAAVLVWTAAHIKIAAGWVATQVRAVASFVATTASSATQATLSATAWLGAQVRIGAGWLATQVRAIGTFVVTQASSGVHAAATALRWLAAQAAIGLGWAVASGRAIASFVAVAAASAIQATITVGRWLVASAVFLAIRGATLLWTAAQWLLNIALDANPISLIILAVAALIAGVIWAYKNVGWFHAAVDLVFGKLMAFGGWLKDKLKPIWDGFVQGVKDAWDGMQRFGDWVKATFGPILDALGKAAQAAGGFLQALNPFAKHSPSLVENVEAGTRQIKSHYTLLADSIVTSATRGGKALGLLTPGTATGTIGFSGAAGMMAASGVNGKDNRDRLDKIIELLNLIANDNPPLTGQAAMARLG